MWGLDDVMDVSQLAQYLAISKSLNNRLPFPSWFLFFGDPAECSAQALCSFRPKILFFKPTHLFSLSLSVSAVADPGPLLDWLPRVRERLVLWVTYKTDVSWHIGGLNGLDTDQPVYWLSLKAGLGRRPREAVHLCSPTCASPRM